MLAQDSYQKSVSSVPPSEFAIFGLEGLEVPHGNFVDPSIVHEAYSSSSFPTNFNQSLQQYTESPKSSARSAASTLSSDVPHPSQTYSPYLGRSTYSYPTSGRSRIASHHSYSSQDDFCSEYSREKGRCPNSDCGKVFKDLKAHMLTHQNERPRNVLSQHAITIPKGSHVNTIRCDTLSHTTRAL